MDREQPARAAGAGARRRGGGEGAAAARVRSGVAAATSTSPTRTTAATAASRTCSTWSRPPAAGCSTSCATACEPRGRRRARDRPRRASLRRVGGGDINDAYRAELDDGGPRSSRRAPTRRPGEYAAEAAALRWLGEPGALGVPEVLGASDEAARARVARRGRARATRRRSAAGLARVHARGRGRASARAGARCGSARSSCPTTRSPDWPAFYAERRLRPLLAPRAAVARGARARSSASATGSPTSPARRSRPPACTATCGAATCCGAAAGRG